MRIITRKHATSVIKHALLIMANADMEAEVKAAMLFDIILSELGEGTKSTEIVSDSRG